MLWDGNYGFSSLSWSEKTRKSNRLQMPLQRQRFLLSYLKTLSAGLAGVWTRGLPLSRLALSQLSRIVCLVEMKSDLVSYESLFTLRWRVAQRPLPYMWRYTFKIGAAQLLKFSPVNRTPIQYSFRAISRGIFVQNVGVNCLCRLNW